MSKIAAVWSGIWAKTDDAGGEQWHPLYRHALDVAAVAQVIVRGDERNLARLASAFQTDPAKLSALTLWLVALHDIGKATAAFQMKIPARWPKGITAPSAGSVPQKPTFHAVGTYWYLTQDTSHLDGTVPIARQFENAFGDADPMSIIPIADAISGHHGRPVVPPGHISPAEVWRPLIGAARDLSAQLAAHFQVAPVALDGGRETAITAYAWWLATLLPLADWVGSNQRFFRPDPNPLPLPLAWETSMHQAQEALDALGLMPVPIIVPRDHNLLPQAAALSPVQAWARDVELPDSPMLAIIEDATGSGKTEAAIILAHRIMAAGFAKGFFVALPTMATANAMFARLGSFKRALFEVDPATLKGASLSLAHGRARALRGEAVPVESYCSPWIAHENRRAFFAQAGAGTIDQAVLSVLPSKYQTLRLRGLADKVLIIDEAHAFDAYVSEEVAALLRFHAAQGGSAILLSATLPRAKREALLRAFADSAQAGRPELRSNAYPLASLVSASATVEAPLHVRTGTERRVRVERLRHDTSLAYALDAARHGAAVAIIRTTVDSAIAARDALISSKGNDAGVCVDLFHARYLPADRKAIEERVLRRFGKAGTAEERAGHVLVATQVIEQSLDIDFDVLITDLAPVDLLIQRAGRLWRHDRGGRRPSAVAAPVLHVVSPSPPADADAKWLREELPQAEWVYRDPALLWRTAMAIFADCDGAGEIVTSTLGEDDHCPGHPRRLVEKVYGGYEHLPEGLEKAWDRLVAETMGVTWQARRACLDPAQPYNSQIEPWIDDARVVTRLGDSITVRLAQERPDGRIVPLASADGATSENWADAEIRVSPAFAREIAPPIPDELKLLQPQWSEYEEGIRLLRLGGTGERQWISPLFGYASTGLTKVNNVLSTAG